MKAIRLCCITFQAFKKTCRAAVNEACISRRKPQSDFRCLVCFLFNCREWSVQFCSLLGRGRRGFFPPLLVDAHRYLQKVTPNLGRRRKTVLCLRFYFVFNCVYMCLWVCAVSAVPEKATGGRQILRHLDAGLCL